MDDFIEEYFKYEFNTDFGFIIEAFGEKRIEELYRSLENIDISNSFNRAEAQTIIKDWYWKNHDDVYKKKKRGW